MSDGVDTERTTGLIISGLQCHLSLSFHTPISLCLSFQPKTIVDTLGPAFSDIYIATTLQIRTLNARTH